MIDTKKFAIAVRTRRGNRTLKEAGEECGITYATLSRIENLKQAPDLRTFSTLCAWMGVPMDYFKLEEEAEVV